MEHWGTKQPTLAEVLSELVRIAGNAATAGNVATDSPVLTDDEVAQLHAEVSALEYDLGRSIGLY